MERPEALKPPMRTSLSLWIWAAYGASLCVLAATTASVGGRPGVFAGSAFVVTACLPLLSRLRTNVLDAPGLWGLVTTLMFGVATLWWLGNPNAPGPGLTRSDVSMALVVS